MLDVLKRIDEIDTSMEGKRKTRIKEVTDSNNSILRDSTTNDSSLLQNDKDSSHISWPSTNNDSDSADDVQMSKNKRDAAPSNTGRYRYTSAALRKHETVKDLKSDLDTMDDISNFSDEEFDPESLTLEDIENDGSCTLDDTMDSSHTLDDDDEHENDHFVDDSFGDIYRENVKQVIKKEQDSCAALETDNPGKSTDRSTRKMDRIENVSSGNCKPVSSVGFSIGLLKAPNVKTESEEKEKAVKSGYESVTEENFEQLCTDLDESFSDDDEESSDSSDSIEEELGWRSRGYNNDFFISRKSVYGSEIIDCYNKARSRHSSKHSSRSSSTCTPKISGSDSDRTTPLAKPSKLFETYASAPITRHGSNSSFKDITNYGKTSRNSDPVVRVGSAGRLSEIADRYKVRSTVEASQGTDSREGGQKGGGGGVRVAELKAALEREIAKANVN